MTKTPLTAVVRSVRNCARCGADHSRMTFTKLRTPGQPPHPRWTHWAVCPATGEPIMMTIQEDGR